MAEEIQAGMTAVPHLWLIRLGQAAEDRHGDRAAEKCTWWAGELAKLGNHEDAAIWQQVAAYLLNGDVDEPAQTVH